MYRHILVPVDFTKKNLAALQTARNFLQKGEARLTLLHVIEKVEFIPAKELRAFYVQLEKSAKEKIRKAAKYLDFRSDIEQRIVYGRRAEEIVKYAVQNDVDLIILTSHKISPDAIVGTVSHKVAILSPCSVLLVK